MIISDAEGDVLRSFDDTYIATRCSGSTETDLRPLLIANGLGATLAPWKRVLPDLERQRTVVSWDHRGLLGSGPPASDRIDAGAHAEDAIACLDHFGAEDFVLASWSNGARIALEIATRYPERVRAWVVVCGGYGQAFGRLLRHLELTSLFPSVAGVAKHFGATLQAPFRTLVARPEVAGVIRQSGIVGPTADTSLLVELLKGFATCDLKMLLSTYEAVAGDAAPDLVSDVEAPVLLVAGEKDPFTSLRMMAEMESEMRNARLEVYERATHYLPIEYPGRLSDDMRKFFADLAV